MDDAVAPERLYLDLLKTVLTRTGFPDSYQLIPPGPTWRLRALHPVAQVLQRVGIELVRKVDPKDRAAGRDWPSDAETMIGVKRLAGLEECILKVLQSDIPGDIIETGVWRGGATIFMRAVLKAYNITDRMVWVADSFQGLPKADLAYPEAGATHFHGMKALAVSESDVRANFARYGLLDSQVRFLVGWFSDTLPTAPIDRLALIRLDGDMYESTMDALIGLYPKLSVGGYVIIDDLEIAACKRAVDDYRSERGIADEIKMIDWTCGFWCRSA